MEGWVASVLKEGSRGGCSDWGLAVVYCNIRLTYKKHKSPCNAFMIKFGFL